MAVIYVQFEISVQGAPLFGRGACGGNSLTPKAGFATASNAVKKAYMYTF